jgi:molecular chaperone GrpE
MPNSHESEDRVGPTAGRQQVADAPPQDVSPGEDSSQRDLAAELAQTEDRYKRALADLDNYRKRSARETERRIEEAREAQLREWLEVVDSLERALFMQPDDPVVQGLRAVLEQMEAVLARQGVTRMDAAGGPFDPERHEAVGVRPADGVSDNTVVDVTRSGFERDGHVLRPAEVVVSRSGSSNQ